MMLRAKAEKDHKLQSGIFNTPAPNNIFPLSVIFLDTAGCRSFTGLWDLSILIIETTGSQRFHKLRHPE